MWSWIKQARGKGMGKALMKHALERAKKLAVKSVDLTSRPSRETANMLYQSLGYQIRETNVYRHKIS
jgi:ribosomal protein S18 acetylase RimI-like enzyme